MQIEPVFQEDVLLKELSTFGIGGRARYYFVAKSIDQMVMVVRYAIEKKMPYMVLGNGSNCLFPDEGYQGLIIHNKIDTFSMEGGRVIVGGGYSIAAIGVKTAKMGFGGLEFAAGVPGTVGGAVFMNAGCMGQNTCDSLLSVEILDEKGERGHLLKEMIIPGYRSSIFQDKQYVILMADFQLYEDRSSHERQKEMVEYRLRTQPYRDRSAGSVFKNPANASAGALIERAGLKGLRIGDAMISPLHANFIVNVGNATAEEVKALIRRIHDEVYDKCGIELQCEIRVIDDVF